MSDPEIDECDECGGDGTITCDDEDGRTYYSPCPKCDPEPADAPERPPEVIRVWHILLRTTCSFSHIPDWPQTSVVVPFPLRIVNDPERGAVYAGLWGDGPRYGPAEVLKMAERGECGWELAGMTGEDY